MAEKPSTTHVRLHLKLFIADKEKDSVIAQENVNYICTTYLKNESETQIIDVTKDFQTALKNQVYVTPTLIVQSSEEKLKIVGNLSDTKKLLDLIVPSLVHMGTQ